MMAVACGTSAVYLTVKRPAEINLKEYRKIAMGDIANQPGSQGRTARDLADELTSSLFASGQFDVLDRQHLARVMTEHSLSETGIIDGNTAPALGRVIGTAALVFGRIQTDSYKEDLTKGKPYKDKEGGTHQTHTRKGTYQLAANLQVIDIETARILAVKTLSASRSVSRTADLKDPDKIDRGALYGQCLKEISQQFIRMVAPYDVQVRAAFLTDKQLPEVDRAVSFFRIGEWGDGMSLLRGATTKAGLPTEIQAKAFYNLGLAETYTGEFDEALEHLKTALSLDPSSKRIQNAILKAKMEKESAAKLKEQL